MPRTVYCVFNFALLMLIGCGGNPSPDVNRYGPGGERVRPAGARHLSPDQVVDSDPCAVQLQNLEGALLQYFALNHRLPNSLQDLNSVADLDQPLQFNCPETGQPYTYTTTGLSSANQQKKIIVYDSVPHKDGKRWCILMPPITGPHATSLSMEVVALPQAAFRQFYPAD